VSNTIVGSKPTSTPPPALPQTMIQLPTYHAVKREDSAPLAPPPVPSHVPSMTTVGADVPTISDALRQVIKEEILTTMVPLFQEMLDSTVKDSVVKPLRSSIGRLNFDTNAVASAVSSGVEASVRAYHADSTRNVLIPMLESVTNQILTKLSDHVEKAVLPTAQPNKDLEIMAQQIRAMGTIVSQLTSEVHALREAVAANQQQAVPANVPSSNVPSVGSSETIKNEIISLLRAKKYMEAFTKGTCPLTCTCDDRMHVCHYSPFTFALF
jgi:outer membrane murein-binding lipoprotein Lpp